MCSIVDLLNKSKIKVEKKNNKLTGKYVENMRETYVDDNTKIIFLKHFNESSHPIGKEYTEPTNHYNIVLHKCGINGRWKKIINAHLIEDLKKSEWVLLITEYE